MEIDKGRGCCVAGADRLLCFLELGLGLDEVARDSARFWKIEGMDRFLRAAAADPPRATEFSSQTIDVVDSVVFPSGEVEPRCRFKAKNRA